MARAFSKPPIPTTQISEVDVTIGQQECSSWSTSQGDRLRTMVRPTKTLTTKVPNSLLIRARRCAKGMGLSLPEFVRRCVEGRVNQIEASRL